MDRQAVPPPPPPPHDYAAAAMAYAQQQQQQQQRPPPTTQQQQQQFGFPPQHQQQFGPPSHFMPPHPSMQQQFPYPHHLPPQQQQHPISSQLHGHAPPPPTPPHLLHQQHAPPHPYPAHYPPHLVPAPFHGPYDSAPPPAPPPADPELHKRIDKLVEYATKNGPEFELMIREKQKDNPEYRFLFGGEGNGYYRHKLWLSTRLSGGPFVPSFPPASSMPMMNPASNPMMNLVPQMQQPPFPPFYDPQQLHHHQPQSFGAHSRPDFDPSSGAFKVRPGLLPPDVAMELDNMLNTLNGTKESIKSTKMWFMQRSSFALALAEALRDKIFAVDDSERQLHIIYLANDILFDSLQRRTNVRDIDKEALAFKPVMGAMLARVYHNPQNKEENQSRLQKILQFWASKEVYDQDTIKALEAEMVGGAMTAFSGPPKEVILAPAGTMAGPGFQHASQWQPDRQGIVMEQDLSEKQVPPLFAKQPFVPSPTSAVPFQGSMLINSSVQSAIQHPPPHILQQPPTNTGEKLPPYPLFPPGLIPGMVRKMQIGSGVPYSPLSPLDIPTMIPPSDVSQSEILHRVSKFFKEIGEVNPSEGPMNSNDEYDDYERDSPVRKGGACIPPPPNLQVDPETGTYPDGSVERKPAFGSSGRLGLGATADPNEVSQYDDVYTSYRKKRSTNYHSSMSARAGTK